MNKVAVVTGSNKGIGYGIVRALCKKFEGDVYLTSRNVERGQQAIADLNKEGLSPKFHQLDIDSTESIETLKKFLSEKYGGLDVLVNNAGIAYKGSSQAPFAEQAEVSCKTNFFGTLNVCNILFPILRPHARVVHVSSMVSTFAIKGCKNPELKQQLSHTSSISEVEKLITSFIDDCKAGSNVEKGWPTSAYGMSKVGVSAMTPHQQAAFDKDGREDIVVNCCCPGYVDTDMSSHQGTLTIDQGAETPVYLALLPPNTKSPRGNYVKDLKIVDWTK